MKKSDFYFDLPERLIAQHPLEQRDASRLMVLDRADGSVTHRHFRDLLEYVQPGDCIVFNNSRVIPARLMGHAVGRTTPIEVLLLTDRGDGLWECLTRPGRRCRRISRKSWTTPSANRRFTPKPPVLRQRLRLACILPKSCLRNSSRRASSWRLSRCTSAWAPSARSRKRRSPTM